ncbi:MAG: hypothetical protein RJQ09_21105 [Cyclobacteriaceae bacterium]
MSGSADDKMRDILKAKFENFEAPVKDDAWAAIKPQPSANLGGKVLAVSAIVMMAAVLLYLSNADYSVGQEAKEVVEVDAKDLIVEDEHSNNQIVQGPSIEASVPEATIVKRIIGNTSAEEIIDSSDETTKSIALKLSGSPDVKSDSNPNQANTTTPSNQATFSPISSIPRSTLLIALPPRIESISPQRNFYISSSPINLKEINPSTKSGKWKVELLNEFSLAYLNYQPNEGDDYYFFDGKSGFDMSLGRLGVSPTVNLKWSVAQNLELSTGLAFQFQKYPVNFSFQSYNSSAEVLGGNSTNQTFTTISSGLNIGISYLLKTRNVENSFDFGLEQRYLLNDAFNSNTLIGFHKNLFNVRGGITYYLPSKSSHRWMIRPFAKYALNKTTTESALQVTPYVFGVGFGVEL